MKNIKDSIIFDFILVLAILSLSYFFSNFLQNYNEEKHFVEFKELTGRNLSFEEYKELSAYEIQAIKEFEAKR